MSITMSTRTDGKAKRGGEWLECRHDEMGFPPAEPAAKPDNSRPAVSQNKADPLFAVRDTHYDHLLQVPDMRVGH